MAVTANVFAANEEIGTDLAEVEWAATPLGRPQSWPQSLRTAVSILLSSRFSMWMAWGPELTFFCNAAYRRNTLARKYPWALGRPASEVWAEIWDDIGPRIDSVLATGKATWDEALLLFLERSGYPEETYHTFSYSPLRDDAGAVVGMLCVVSEETERVIGERRMVTLRELGSDPTVARTEGETLSFAARQLGHNRFDLPFTLTYLFTDEGGARLAATTGIDTGHPAAPASLPLDAPDATWPTTAVRRGESVLVALAGPAFAGLPAGPWERPPTQAMAVPLSQQGGAPYGFLVVGLNRYRPADAGYRGFVELVAGHLAAGIASARSFRAEQQRAEELAALDKAKTTFFSNISHEFRTPLTLIMGPVQELEQRLADADPDTIEDLAVIRRNGLRLGKLVNTLLDFSRIEAGRTQARFVPVDLAAATAELASLFRSAVERAGLVLAVDCPPLPQPVYLDRGMWEKVLLNLLSNALKFTFDGTVTVSVRAEDDVETGTGAVVTVADTGVGVPAGEMPRLFDRFHRIENTRARSNEGSGIGLALVRELVSLHGGTITAESSDSADNHGTRFTIRLPFGTGHLPADAVGPEEPPAATDPLVSSSVEPFVQEALRWLPAEQPGAALATISAGTNETVSPATDRAAPATVVVADDNSDMRDYLTRLLGAAGYRVRAAVDGAHALDVVREDCPDLVISDVMMPRLDGLALLARLRADPRTAAVPVLLLSARAGQEASIEGLRAGADDYLFKPFSAAELLARARATIELARLRSHQARWRTALIDSLQEAFFVCDQSGTVVEINSAFTDILGYGPEGLPYSPRQPWWPDPGTDPDGFRRAADSFASLLADARGHHAVPVLHRDGRRLWISIEFNHAIDPDTGAKVIVGTFRDVTVEHHAQARETAVAALTVRLAAATSVPDAIAGALSELRTLWTARSVTAAVMTLDAPPAVSSTDPSVTSWDTLSEPQRATLHALAERPTLNPTADLGTGDGSAGAGITLHHPDGRLALWLHLDRHQPFGEPDLQLLATLAGHLAQALARTHQVEQQRETALALQRAILGPAQLPAGFAVRYEPAARPLEVGGDWYDTIALPDGRTGIVVGDCVGHGLAAAAVMGQLRSACRALLLQHGAPARTLIALDQFAAGIPGAFCTTVFCATLDSGSGRLTYSSAGHPPAILAHPDGTARLLDQAGAFPLAVRLGAARNEATCTMPAGASLLMYTDGLVERRHRPLDQGIEAAASAVQHGLDLPVDDLATRIMTQLAPPGGYEDDVALLLYRHPAPLELAFTADVAELAPVRDTLRAWLGQADLPASTVQSVLVAAGEAVANSIEHASRDTVSARVRLKAELFGPDLHLTVSDTGRWKIPQRHLDTHRGRGITVMHAMMQHVTITSDDTGTTAHLQTRIAR